MKRKLVKLVELALGSAIVLSLVTNVLAESTTLTDAGDTDIDVMGTLKAVGIASEENDFYIVLTWETTNAAIGHNFIYKWDPEHMKYVKDTDELADSTDAKSNITITNYSNGNIKYSISYETASGITSIETPDEGYADKLSGKLGSAVPSDYVLPNTGLSEYTEGFTPQSVSYKGTIHLSNYSDTASNVTLGKYTVTVAAAVNINLPNGEVASALDYTGEATKGSTITIGEETFVVLSNDGTSIRAMANKNIGGTKFSNTNYWADDFYNGIIHQYDSIDLTQSNIKAKLDEYAEAMGIDAKSVTLPTYAELNGLTQEQRNSGYAYWTRSAYDAYGVYYVGSSGGIYYYDYYDTHGLRPVVILAS